MDVCSLWILGGGAPMGTPALMEVTQKFMPSHPSSQQEETMSLCVPKIYENFCVW